MTVRPPDPDLKKCSGCGETKPLAAFHRDRSQPMGVRSNCKSCVSTYMADRYVSRQRDIYYLRTYGVTGAEFDARLVAQGGVCSICLQPPDRPRMDHDHDTGRPRDVLCHNCNVGLGHFMDNPALLVRATEYLGRHGKLAIA